MIDSKQTCLFDERFLESYVGSPILKDATVALVELIANAWDAGATKVDVFWPNKNNSTSFCITDNGCGMTENEFLKRWRTLAYNRINEQGHFAEFPEETKLPKRRAFGRNGKGRFATFCFGQTYTVKTTKNDKEIFYRVMKGNDVPIVLEKISTCDKKGHGTIITAETPRYPTMTISMARSEVSMRFLTDPSFEVKINGQIIHFHDIPESNVEAHTIEIDGIGSVELKIIDVKDSDKTTKQHGIAWHVNRRLVGECTWKGTEHESFLDGRSIEAKRYTFIIFADCLEEAVLPDWTSFDIKNNIYNKVNPIVQEFIKNRLLDYTKGRRKQTFDTVQSTYNTEFRAMSPLSKEKWKRFIEEVQENCPTIADKELIKLSGVLANLELSKSKYALIDKMFKMRWTHLVRQKMCKLKVANRLVVSGVSVNFFLII